MEDRVGFHLAGKQFNLPRKSASRGSAGWRGAGFPNGIASWLHVNQDKGNVGVSMQVSLKL